MNNPFKKFVKITTNLPKGIEDQVVGTEIRDGDDIVGKVIAYEKETGKATMKIKAVAWKKVAGGDIGLIKDMYHEEPKNN